MALRRDAHGHATAEVYVSEKQQAARDKERIRLEQTAARRREIAANVKLRNTKRYRLATEEEKAVMLARQASK